MLQLHSWEEQVTEDVFWFGRATGAVGGRLLGGLLFQASPSRGIINDKSIQRAGVRLPQDPVHTACVELKMCANVWGRGKKGGVDILVSFLSNILMDRKTLGCKHQFYLVLAGQSSDALAQSEVQQTDSTLLPLVQEPRPRSHPDRSQTTQHVF